MCQVNFFVAQFEIKLEVPKVLQVSPYPWNFSHTLFLSRLFFADVQRMLDQLDIPNFFRCHVKMY